jgi:hypothetical protein
VSLCWQAIPAGRAGVGTTGPAAGKTAACTATAGNAALAVLEELLAKLLLLLLAGLL